MSAWLAALVWAASGVAGAFAWLVLERAPAGAPPAHGIAVMVHLVRLALPVGALLGLLLALVALLSRRRAALGPLATALSAAPLSFAAARSLADGEGVSVGRIPLSLVVALGTVSFAALATVVVTLASSRTSRLARGLALAASLGLALVAVIAARTYGSAAWLCYAVASAGLSAVIARPLLAGRQRAVRAAIALGLVVLVALVAPSPREPSFEDGRRSVQLALGIGATVDSLVFGPDRRVLRRVRFDLPPRASVTCPAPASSPPSDPPPRVRNVVMVSIDAVRTDVIGARVQGRAVTPHVESFLRSATVPERAYTTYPATFFALAGAFTGLTPGRILLAPEPPRTLLSVLAHAIDRTVAIVPSKRYFARDRFRRYVLQDVDVRRARDAEAQVDATIDVVREARSRGERFAVWLHLFEPHHTYERHPGFDFGPDVRGRYLGEVAYADAAVGRLLDTLRAERGLDDTLVVFFADHGEALGERGYEGHHLFLDHWIAEIPIALRVPGEPPRRERGVAAVVDVAPTVLAAMGLSAPHPMEGRDLLSSLDPERAVVAESFSTGGASLDRFGTERVEDEAELRRRVELYAHSLGRYPGSVSLTQGRYRLIVWRTTGVVQLFDRSADPAERHDLFRTLPEVRERMLGALERWHREQSVALLCALDRSRAERR